MAATIFARACCLLANLAWCAEGRIGGRHGISGAHSPQFISDAVSWGAIGARNTESQIHRQLASGLSMPVGFKNATDGSVKAAVNGCFAAAQQHTFFGIDHLGRACAVETLGNPDCHVVLRGSIHGPNYDAESVAKAWKTYAPKCPPNPQPRMV